MRAKLMFFFGSKEIPKAYEVGGRQRGALGWTELPGSCRLLVCSREYEVF